eukprot:gene16369-biopygen4607
MRWWFRQPARYILRTAELWFVLHGQEMPMKHKCVPEVLMKLLVTFDLPLKWDEVKRNQHIRNKNSDPANEGSVVISEKNQAGLNLLLCGINRFNPSSIPLTIWIF